MGEWGSGGVGEWEMGGVGELESGKNPAYFLFFVPSNLNIHPLNPLHPNQAKQANPLPNFLRSDHRSSAELPH